MCAALHFPWSAGSAPIAPLAIVSGPRF
jgi:hypothetical protein